MNKELKKKRLLNKSRLSTAKDRLLRKETDGPGTDRTDKLHIQNTNKSVAVLTGSQSNTTQGLLFL